MSPSAHEMSELKQTGLRRVAEAVRRACIEEALHSYEDARVRGLCAEGAWEAAVGAMRSLDAEQIADEAIRNRPSKR